MILLQQIIEWLAPNNGYIMLGSLQLLIVAGGIWFLKKDLE